MLKTGQNLNEVRPILGRLSYFLKIFNHYSDKEFRYVGLFLFNFVYRLLFENMIGFPFLLFFIFMAFLLRNSNFFTLIGFFISLRAKFHSFISQNIIIFVLQIISIYITLNAYIIILIFFALLKFLYFIGPFFNFQLQSKTILSFF